ncbi:MAG: YdaU family protein [Rhodocyclaceae bacterium]|nr:YdaU family protein [Rhodocyclaceae bacterium]
MNYYEHHLGDYVRDTAHLSMLEDAAYRRLLDAYYIRERPLPCSLDECCKLARAYSDQEREAVAYVLREFFVLQDDGYHNRRADAEIARYRDKQVKARRSAQARWSKRAACDGNAVALQPQCDGNAHQTPVHQTPVHLIPRVCTSSSTTRARKAVADDRPAPASASPKPVASPPPAASPPAADPIHARAVELAVLLRKHGAALQAADPRVRSWAERGVTDAQAIMALQTAKRQRRARGSPQPINAGYLDAILQSQDAADSRPTARRSIHDERAEVIAVLTGRRRAEGSARIIDITPAV